MAAGRDNVKARRRRKVSRFEFFHGTEPGMLRRTLVPDSGPGGGTVGEGFNGNYKEYLTFSLGFLYIP